MSTTPAPGFRLLLMVLVGVGLLSRHASGVTVYRIGSPFSTSEKDSLEGIGIGFEEIEWSASHLLDALDPDSLEAGSLQPNFFTEDEDIAATLLDRGGRVWVKHFANENRVLGLPLLDRDPNTGHSWQAIDPEHFSGSTIAQKVTLDLGGRFLIREVRLRPLSDRPDHYLEAFSLGISDLGFDVYRIPFFTRIAEVAENKEPEVRLVLNPAVTTEAVQLRIYRTTPKEVGIADFEVYGGGFVSRASYESEVIDLDEAASWGKIRWSGRRDSDARVDIRTRSGTDPQPVIFWEARTEQQDSVRFLRGGGELDFAEYKRQYGKLDAVHKPGDERDWATPDAEHWSSWSSLYPFDRPGVDVESPGQRRFFQVRVDFASTTEDGGRLESMEFRASSPPAVSELIGEIFPNETEIGTLTQFTYYIRPAIESGDSSFDGVEISTPSGVASVDSLRIDGIDQGDFSWRMQEDGLGFEVLLPRKLAPTDSGALVEVVFKAPVFREVGTLFKGKVFDTSRPHEVRQRVVAGDANNELGNGRLSVSTSLSNSLLFAPRVAPNPFTPNGDGFNDSAVISYKLLRVTAAVPVAIGIFDLSGRLVKQVHSGRDPLGEYVHVWDGSDEANRPVAPGLYLYRISADLQTEQAIRSGIISVAY